MSEKKEDKYGKIAACEGFGFESNQIMPRSVFSAFEIYAVVSVRYISILIFPQPTLTTDPETTASFSAGKERH